MMIYKKITQKDFDEAEKAYNDCDRAERTCKIKQVGPERKHFTKGQSTASLLAILLLVYSILFTDIPAFFLSASFLVWIIQYFICPLAKNNAETIRSALKSLSLTLFVGSIILIFL